VIADDISKKSYEEKKTFLKSQFEKFKEDKFVEIVDINQIENFNKKQKTYQYHKDRIFS